MSLGQSASKFSEILKPRADFGAASGKVSSSESNQLFPAVRPGSRETIHPMNLFGCDSVAQSSLITTISKRRMQTLHWQPCSRISEDSSSTPPWKRYAQLEAQPPSSAPLQ